MNIANTSSPDNIKLIINHLLSDQSKQIQNSFNTPIFKFEFYVFDLIIPLEIFKKMTIPILTFRLFDYPSQSIVGSKDEKSKKISFRTGKSCIFEMEKEILKKKLMNEPLYVMLIDSFSSELKIIASSKLNISVFSYNQFMEEANDKTLPRRNILKLYDNMQEAVCEFDLTLILKRESFPYSNKVIQALSEEGKQEEDIKDEKVEKVEKQGKNEDCQCETEKKKEKIQKNNKKKEKDNKYNYTINIRKENVSKVKESNQKNESKEKNDLFTRNKFPPPLFYNAKSETQMIRPKQSTNTNNNHIQTKENKELKEKSVYSIYSKQNTYKIETITENCFSIEEKNTGKSKKNTSPSVNSLKYLIKMDEIHEDKVNIQDSNSQEYDKFDEENDMKTIQTNSKIDKDETISVEIEEDFN